MKTIFITLVTFFLVAMSNNVQEEIASKVTYDGYYDGLYSFTTVTEDKDDYGVSIEFENISPEILKKFDLKSEAYVEQEFMITYTEEVEIDENEDETITYTLVSIEKVKED